MDNERKPLSRKPIFRRWFFFVASLFIFLTRPGYGQAQKAKEFKFEGSKIEGQREKPRDLYILPWQESVPLGKDSLQLEVLGSFDEWKSREELAKEKEYFLRTGENVQ